MDEKLKIQLREKLKDSDSFLDNIMSLDTALTLLNSMLINTIKELAENPKDEKRINDLEMYRNEIEMLYSGQNRPQLLEKIKNVYSPILLEQNKKGAD